MRRNVQVTAADIARLAGVGRAAVSNWRRRHEDFPQPAGGTATSPSFPLDEVQRWLRAHTEGRPLPPEEWLWQDLRAAAEEDELPGLLADLGAFLIYLDRRPADWAATAAADDAALAAELPRRVRAACAGPMTDPEPPATLGRDRIPLVREVARLALRAGAAETFAFLRERYFELRTKRTYATPAPVAELVAGLVAPCSGRVLDPACGWGALLAAVAARPGNRVDRLLGQDIDGATARLTAVHLALRSGGVDVRAGDSLRHDAFVGVQADAVVCNPPFNDRNWGHEELATDPRWEYGLPPRVEPELAWVQHALAHLRSGGTAVLVMPPAAAGRRSGRRIRARLVRRGALRAVITLPPGSVPNTAVALTLWVLRRPAGPEAPGHVLMVDTSAYPEAFAEVALRAWTRFSHGRDPDLPGACRRVPVIDLLDEDVDLTPARHLASPSEELSGEWIAGRREQAAESLRAAADLMPAVRPAVPGRGFTWVPVAELVRRGMLEVHHQAPVRPGERAEAPDGLPVLTLDDVLRDAAPSEVTPEAAVQRNLVLRPGDVVVPQFVQRPLARVVREGGALLGLRLSLLRPDPEQLDPDFVAGFLSSSATLRTALVSTTGTRSQVDVRRAELPLLPLAEQRGYGAAFRRLAEFESGLRRAAALGEEAVRLLTDGLAHGSVRPAVPERG